MPIIIKSIIENAVEAQGGTFNREKVAQVFARNQPALLQGPVDGGWDSGALARNQDITHLDVARVVFTKRGISVIGADGPALLDYIQRLGRTA
jgi:hypothetical protein